MAYKLGKKAAIRDPRTLKLSRFMRALPPMPEVGNCDTGVKFPLPMFANDQYGCCVISGRAHQTLRMEHIEQQGKIVSISDQEVIQEYLKESGGVDSGLYMLSSLKCWRKGWKCSGERHNIRAFAAVDVSDFNQLKFAVWKLSGLQIGLNLPVSAENQIGETWEVAEGPDGRPGGWGGHCVYIVGYNQTGPVCVTWGAYQQMTWAFYKRYCDEAYALVDERNNDKSVLNVDAMVSALNAITGEQSRTWRLWTWFKRLIGR